MSSLLRSQVRAAKTTSPVGKLRVDDWQNFVDSVVFVTSEVATGGVAHFLDTYTSYTSGKILSLRNAGSEIVYVGYDGTLSVAGALSVGDQATTRTNLGLGSVATHDASDFLSLTGGTLSGQVFIASGSLANPSIAFAADQDTGIMLGQSGANLVTFVSGGVVSASANGTQFNVTGYGTAGSGWIGPQNQGIYYPTTGAVRFTSTGAIMSFDVYSAITSSLPFSFSQEWNASGVTFTGLKLDITDTASASASLLMDLQVGAVSKFKVRKDGVATLGSGNAIIGIPNDQVNIVGASLHYSGSAVYLETILSGVPLYLGSYNGDIVFSQNFAATELVRIKASGNVGIGTASPGVKLDIASSIGSTSDSALRFTYTDGPSAYHNDITNLFSGTANLHTMNFVVTSNSSTVTPLILRGDGNVIMNAGNVGIGIIPTQKLDVAGDIRSNTTGFIINSGLGYSLGGMSSPAAQVVRFGGQNVSTLEFWTGYSYTNMMLDGVNGGTLSLTPVWNNALATFTAFVINPTDTASASASLLMDLQVGGVSKVSINKSGGVGIGIAAGSYALYANGSIRVGSQFITTNGSVSSPTIISVDDANTGPWNPAADTYAISTGGVQRFTIDTSTITSTLPYVTNSNRFYNRSDAGAYVWGASDDTAIFRDAAGILAQRNSTNAQEFRIYNTYTDASNYERMRLGWTSNEFRLEMEYAGTGSNRSVVIKSGGSINLYANGNYWYFSSTGHLIPNSTATWDIGGSSNRVRSYYGGGNTVTTSAPVIDIAQTWNDGAVTFTGILANFTSTASASTSLLMDLQVGGVSKFKTDKNGWATFAQGVLVGGGDVSNPTLSFWSSSGTGFYVSSPGTNARLNYVSGGSNRFNTGYGLTQIGADDSFAWAYGSDASSTADLVLRRTAVGTIGVFTDTGLGTYGSMMVQHYYVGNRNDGYWGSGGLTLKNSGVIGWSSTSNGTTTPDVVLYRDAAGILAQRNSTNNQTSRVYGTYTDASNGRWLATTGHFSSSMPGIYADGNGTGANPDLYIGIGSGTGLIRFYTTTNVWQIFSAGHWNPDVTGTYDIGRTANRVRSYYGGGNTVTTSLPVLDLAQTWNAGAVAFTGILADFTATACSSASNLLELKLSGTTAFRVGYDGRIYTPYISYAKAFVASDVGAGGTTYGAVLQYTTTDPYGAVRNGLTLGGTGFVAWDNSGAVAGSPDVAFYRNAAGIVEINSGTAGILRDLTLRNIEGQTGYIELIEHGVTDGAPTAPSANRIRIYAEDNAGSTAIMALPSSGPAINLTASTAFNGVRADKPTPVMTYFGNGIATNNGPSTRTDGGGSGVTADTTDTSRACVKFTQTVNTGSAGSTWSTQIKAQHSPAMWADFKQVSTSKQGLMIGFSNNGLAGGPGGGAPHAVLFGWQDGVDTNYRVYHATNAVPTSTDTGVPMDNNWHDVLIYSPDAGVTWKVELDGTEVYSGTTNLPTVTTALAPVQGIACVGTGSTGNELRTTYCVVQLNNPITG